MPRRPRLALLLALAACSPASAPTTPGSSHVAPQPAAKSPWQDATAFAARQRAWFELRKAAGAAMQRQEFHEAAKLYREALDQSPDHTGVRYSLARALALAGLPDLAFATLADLTAYAQVFPLAQDPAFEALRADPRLAELAARFAGFAAPEARTEVRVAATLAAPTFMPECAAPDPATGDLFLSSVHERRIVRVRRDGRADDFVPPGGHGLWSVLGLRVDPARGLLWATTAATTATRDLQDADKDRAALLAFRLEDGALAEKHLVEEPGVAHNLGDLVVMRDGVVVVSDAGAGMLHVLGGPGDTLRPLVPAGTFASPQGLAVSESSRKLYLADYALGLFILDIYDGDGPIIREIPAPPGECFRGIDGLDHVKHSLIAVQNGVAPARVTRIDLSEASEAQVRGVAPLLRGLDGFDEPTLARVAGDDLYLVANSHWNRLDRDGKLPADAAGWSGPVVLAAPHRERDRPQETRVIVGAVLGP